MKKVFCESLRNYFREYCKSSSVHGLRYIGEKERTYFERFWWFVIFVTCLVGCGFAIHEVYNKWDQSPVIVNFANSGTPIYKIPFPGVTVCPETKLDESKFNFTEVMLKIKQNKNFTATEKLRFNYMSSVCHHNPDLLKDFNDTLLEDFYDVLNDLKPVFFIENCVFLSETINCSRFVPILTKEGICYTFNMIDRELIFKENVVHYKNFHKIERPALWSLQNGYDNNAEIDVYPHRASLSGAENGLTFAIRTPNKSTDFACRDSVQGYRVVLHTPMTIPWPSQKFFRIPLHQNVIGSVQPVIVTTSKRIERYPPEQRNCYFGDERELKYFKNYTSSNCKLECMTNYTLAMCGCVDFYMPRENDTKICSGKVMDCMYRADHLMQRTILAKELMDSKTEQQLKNISEVPQCGCLPICSDLTYETDTTQTDWNWNQWLIARRNFSCSSYVASLTLFFKSENFFSSERNELYGPIDFTANFGGLLSLFTGFSFISLMEIIYFLSLRIICNLWLNRKWFGPKSAPKVIEVKKKIIL